MRISVIRTMTRIGHRGGRGCVSVCGQEERGRSYCSSSLKVKKKNSRRRECRRLFFVPKIFRKLLETFSYLSLRRRAVKLSKRQIRQIIANANVQDFEELYRYLYDNASEFAPGKEGTVAYYINEYSYYNIRYTFRRII